MMKEWDEFEFHFLTEGLLRLIHIVQLPSEGEACKRAVLYLDASDQFDAIIVRRGGRFMRMIEREAEWKIPAFPRALLS